MKEIEKRVIYSKLSMRYFCYIISEILYLICVLMIYYLMFYEFLGMSLIFKDDKIYISFLIFGIIFGIISSCLYKGNYKDIVLGLHLGGPIIVGFILTGLVLAIKTFIDCI